MWISIPSADVNKLTKSVNEMKEKNTQGPIHSENNERRTQSERTQHTRILICEATLEVIGKHGYRNANTTMIAKQAGVSRGALTHHFPTKVDLVSAAFDSILEEWERKRLKFRQESIDPTNIELYIRFLWEEIFNHPQYVAMLELMLAARGDEKLRKQLTTSLKLLTTNRQKNWRAILGHDINSEKYDTLMMMTTCLLRGMSMQEVLEQKPGIEKKIIDLWVEILCQKVER